MRDWIGSLQQSLVEFRRRRVFRVAAVYVVVAWVLIQLASATFEPLGLPMWSNRLLIILLLSDGYLNWLWQPEPWSRKALRDPAFQSFAQDIGMVAYWKRYGWPDLCNPPPKMAPMHSSANERWALPHLIFEGLPCCAMSAHIPAVRSGRPPSSKWPSSAC